MSPGLPGQLRAAAGRVLPFGTKRRLKQLLRLYHRTFLPFGAEDLQAAARALGVTPGDVLLIHSSFDRFMGFRGGPAQVIRTFQSVVGTGGTLLMPTASFRDTAIAWALEQQVFDARQTPSRMGLISEMFRRSPGVLRSAHPTHSVAAWGRKAADMIAGHERAATPCGVGTPYARLLEHDGKILLAGVPPNTMTFCYFVAEQLEPRLPVRVLTTEQYALRWRDHEGRGGTLTTRLFSPDLDHDLGPLVAELKRRRQWRRSRVGGLPLVLVSASEVYRACEALAGRGEFLRTGDRGLLRRRNSLPGDHRAVTERASEPRAS